MAVFPTLVVYCHAKDEVLEHRIAERGEIYEAQPKSRVIKSYYNEILVGFNDDQVLEIDTTGNPPLKDLSKKIQEKIKAIQSRTKK